MAVCCGGVLRMLPLRASDRGICMHGLRASPRRTCNQETVHHTVLYCSSQLWGMHY